jgi:hypothetical protein
MQLNFVYQLLDHAYALTQTQSYKTEFTSVDVVNKGFVVTDKKSGKMYTVAPQIIIDCSVSVMQRLEQRLTQLEELHVLSIALDCMLNHGKQQKEKTYKIVRRFLSEYSGGQRTARTNLTLEQALKHVAEQQPNDQYIDSYMEE